MSAHSRFSHQLRTSASAPTWWRHGDSAWQALIIFVSVFVVVLVGIIGLILWNDSALARETFGLDFILPQGEAVWNPIFEQYNAWPMIYGTLLTSVVAIIIALPVSLGIAIFLAELCPDWLRLPLGWMVELLAAIPSVVYGLWGIFVFLPAVVTPLGNFIGETLGNVPLPFFDRLFLGPTPESGASRLAAALILAIMITPTISAITRDVFLAIPRAQREAALALGSTQWETVWRVLIPYGLSGILGAVILGLGRALGETMAVTMVIGNSFDGTDSLLRPGYTMASIIANQFAEAFSPMHLEALIGVGLTLFFITLGLNTVARLLVWQVARKTPQESR